MYDEAAVFKELAALLRVRPQLQQICRFGAGWSFPHEPESEGWAPFHIVTSGACLLEVAHQPAIELEAGDVAILPHGEAHTVRSLPAAGGPSHPVRVERRLYDELLLKSNFEGEPDTKLICGRMCFEHPSNNMVLAALPPLVALTSNAEPDPQRVRRIVEAIRDELEADRLGGAVIAAGLASSLMMLGLLTHFQSQRNHHGLLALLARPPTAKALAGMLTEPARDWTLDELSKRACTSRATLVRLFRSAVDKAPLEFLADLRFNIARHRLRNSSSPIAAIAREIGYESEAAFSRAYRRRFNLAPGADR